MRRHLVLGLALCVSLHLPVLAAGPLAVNGAGQPLVWTTQPIPYNPDRGTLGTMSNAAAVAFVSARFATWAAVPTATLSFADAGLLPVDVTAANAMTYFGVCGDGLNPIIFDTDGSIIRNLFGIGNENFIIGAAGPDCVSYVPPAITEASAILNGRFIDGVDTQLNPEISLTDFGAVFTHEFGHFVGLDHSQINLAEASDSSSANDNAIATMFPVLINGNEQSSLALDDSVSASMLYPAANFFSTHGSIQGTIVRPDGVSPFQGAYVIARDFSNPRINAVGIASGFLFNPAAPGGPPATNLKGYYELDGLSPGAQYTIEIEGVAPQSAGGSSVGPVDPPAPVAVPEFWNGANEAATNPPDSPNAATTVLVGAGVPIAGIDVTMNSVSGTLPPNDLCSQATAITSFPYTQNADTTGAGESGADPTQNCVAGTPTFNTVWYAVTAQSDGIVTFDTCGSSYDTVLSASTGTCGSLTTVACNNDSNDAVCGVSQARLSFDVVAGQTYLVEVAQRSAPAGGALAVHATLGPRDCVGGSCLPGHGGTQSTQCIAEFLLEPLPTFIGKPPSTIICTDGDECDADGDATNHSCTFHLAVCVNNHDPNLACAPTDVTTIELSKPNPNGRLNKPEDTSNANALLSSIATIGAGGSVLGICLNLDLGPNCVTNADCNSPGKSDGRCYRFVRFQPTAMTPDRCGVSANVVIPLRSLGGGRFKSASKGIRLRATDTARTTDRDSLTLRCRPAS